MNFKKIALAAALLAASVSANAALQLAVDANTEADGELILTVWNTDNQRALTVDLGVRASEYMNNRATVGSFDLDPADVSWLGAGNIRWNVTGSATRFDEFPSSYGYYFTAKEGDLAPNTAGFSEFSAQFAPFATYANAIPGMNATGDVSVNLTYRSEGASYAGSGDVWGDAAGNVSTFFGPFSSTTADQILRAWTGDFVGNDDLTAASAKLNEQYFWDLDLASNSLNYVETPVPAAAWLFGSALLGLAGAVRRRRKTA